MGTGEQMVETAVTSRTKPWECVHDEGVELCIRNTQDGY